MELFTLFGKIAVNNKEANKSIDGVTDKAKQAEGKISEAFSKIGKIVAGTFTVGAVVAFEKKIVSTYATYDDQMRKVQAVSGATGKQFEMLRGKAEEEHTSELQSRQYLVCRLLLEKKHRSNRSPS